MSWHSYLFWLYSWASVVPWACVVYYRYYYQANYSVVFAKNFPQPDRLDKYILMLALPFAFYYVFDVTNILFYLPHISACSWSYFSHHIVSLIGTPCMITMPHYPWFILFPYAWHSLLLMFPSCHWLNVCYILLILIKLKNLHSHPWTLYNHYRVYRVVVYTMLAGPLVMLWYNQCTNNMSNAEITPA